MNAVLHLQIVGLLLITLVLVNLYVPKRFNWKEETAKLSLLTRQIFYVHDGFIILILALFAALTIVLPDQLLQPTPLARSILGGLFVFWLARLLAQFFVYDPRIWRGHRFNTVMHVLFSCLWTYFTATFGYALWTNLQT